MSRRICLALLVGSFALGAPATSLAQSSSQAQYQGVAPETQTPVTGPGGGGTAGGSAANGGTSGSNSTGGTAASGGTSGASGNGGGAATSTPAGGAQSQPTASPQASSDTGPFSGGDFVLIVLACAGLAGLGLVLRRATRRDPAGA
jgi:cobalamin biosynthesis Mg chelatase CobN